MTRRITRPAFKAWLKAQKPGRTFDRCDGFVCPLAKFSGHRVSTEVYYTTGDNLHDLPAWATKFIKAFDAAGPSNGAGTASEALRILSGIK